MGPVDQASSAPIFRLHAGSQVQASDTVGSHAEGPLNPCTQLHLNATAPTMSIF